MAEMGGGLSAGWLGVRWAVHCLGGLRAGLGSVPYPLLDGGISALTCAERGDGGNPDNETRPPGVQVSVEIIWCMNYFSAYADSRVLTFVVDASSLGRILNLEMS